MCVRATMAPPAICRIVDVLALYQPAPQPKPGCTRLRVRVADRTSRGAGCVRRYAFGHAGGWQDNLRLGFDGATRLIRTTAPQGLKGRRSQQVARNFTKTDDATSCAMTGWVFAARAETSQRFAIGTSAADTESGSVLRPWRHGGRMG